MDTSTVAFLTIKKYSFLPAFRQNVFYNLLHMEVFSGAILDIFIYRQRIPYLSSYCFIHMLKIILPLLLIAFAYAHQCFYLLSYSLIKISRGYNFASDRY